MADSQLIPKTKILSGLATVRSRLSRRASHRVPSQALAQILNPRFAHIQLVHASRIGDLRLGLFAPAAVLDYVGCIDGHVESPPHHGSRRPQRGHQPVRFVS